MTAISTSMLSAMRSAIAELLPDTCQVITITHAPDGFGGQTDTRGTASAISCRLDVVSGREQVIGGALQPFTSYILSIPYDTTIDTTNEILFNGITYAVKSAPQNKSWNAVKRIELEVK